MPLRSLFEKRKAGAQQVEERIILKMENISKSFPGVKALQNVDFTLRKGEIHALMGENGAGKSTLIKVLTGVYELQSGKINIDGKSIINRSPQEAQENGISTVYQEVNLCPNLTVAENLFIGREPRKAGFIDWKTMNTKSETLLENLGIEAFSVPEMCESIKADGVFMTSGSDKAIDTALKFVRDGGKILVFSSTPNNLGYANNEIYYRELTVLGSYSPSPQDLKDSLELLKNKQVKVAGLSTDYPLEKIQKAINDTLDNKILKAYIKITD